MSDYKKIMNSDETGRFTADIKNETFTVNSDLVNNELDLKSYFMTCDEFTLYIFNRWGNLVWEQSQDSPFFRGVDKGGKDLEEGVYIYKLVFENFEKQGFIHVLR